LIDITVDAERDERDSLIGFVAQIGKTKAKIPIGFMRVSECSGLQRLLLLASEAGKVDVDRLLAVLKAQHAGDAPILFSSDQIRKAITEVTKGMIDKK
jgi:hypothetical protein